MKNRYTRNGGGSFLSHTLDSKLAIETLCRNSAGEHLTATRNASLATAGSTPGVPIAFPSSSGLTRSRDTREASPLRDTKKWSKSIWLQVSALHAFQLARAIAESFKQYSPVATSSGRQFRLFPSGSNRC